MIRFGGPVFGDFADAHSWAEAHCALGYRATYAPPENLVRDASGIHEVRAALAEHDLILAEVGAWVNPVSTDLHEAEAAFAHLIDRLRLAEALGARCCVDIVGSASPTAWDGADRAGYSQGFIDRVISTFRSIIDAVDPHETVMAFEAMPYYFLDGPRPYHTLLEAIDRPGGSGVHVDLCNMITDPRRFYASADFAAEVFSTLGPRVRSCHLKDLRLDGNGGTVKFHEVMPGTGEIDLAAYMREAERAVDGIPMMLEHLADEHEYDQARANVFRIADQAGIPR